MQREIHNGLDKFMWRDRMYKKVKLIGLTMVASIIFLGGCSQSPKEEMLNTLEEVAQAEQEFKNQQEPLVEIEKKKKKFMIKSLL